MRSLVLVMSAVALLAGRPAPARACGGTFPDVPQPVEQTGGNILFILEPNQVEFHIQITYDPKTTAQSFAWLIPTPAVPEFSIGSELLFRELLRASVPTYGLTTELETCGSTEGGTSETTDAGTTGPGGDTDGGVDILKQEVVGAFEIVVLAGKSAPQLMQWLTDNGYQALPQAEPILQQYLDEGSSVVALKLQHGEELSSIHPIVLRFPGVEGCVPIRLTRIAAIEDLDLRVFALANGRAVPTNFPHVLVNPLKLDWLHQASNYKSVVRAAVDAFKADGRAFVTEYAGPSSVLKTAAFHRPTWNSQAFVGLPATEVVDALEQQGGLVQCELSTCDFVHPLLAGLLTTYLPVPDGVDPGAFYDDLPAHAAMIDVMAWGDGSGFAADMQLRIIEPGAHARALAETWPYLSRLYTTISPDEMIEDPFFLVNADLPSVDDLREAARYVTCDGHAVVTLPDGREVHMDDGAPWPDFPAEMPWEEDIERMTPVGMPQSLVDNTALIDRLLAEWNQQHAPPSGTTADGPTTGLETSETASSTGGDSGGDSDGCGCRHEPRPGAASVVGVFVLLGLARRRPSQG